MTTVVSSNLASLTIAALLSSSTSSTEAVTSKTKQRQSVPAGASGVPLSSTTFFPSASITSVSANQASPHYKTIYVTKTAEPDSDVGTSDLQPGAVAGIAVGGAAGIVLIIGIVYFLLPRRRRRAAEIIKLPSSSGSQSSTVVAEKNGGDMMEAYGTHEQRIYETQGKLIYELEASMPELDGRSFSMESALSPPDAAMIASRHIMSRGRPVRRAGEKG